MLIRPQLSVWLCVAVVLFSILDPANGLEGFTSFVPRRVPFSLSSPSSPRTSRPLSSSSPSRPPSPPYGIRLWSSTPSPFDSTRGPGRPIDTSFRKTAKQLSKLNGEIDAIAAEIRVKEAKRESTPDVAEKAIILKSIDVLNSRLERLIATRDKLIDASIAVPVPVPGKSTTTV